MSKEAAQTHLFTRQPLSVLSKIAFWAFLVGGAWRSWRYNSTHAQ